MSEEKEKYEYQVVEMTDRSMGRSNERWALLGPFCAEGWRPVAFRKKWFCILRRDKNWKDEEGKDKPWWWKKARWDGYTKIWPG